MSGSGLVTSLIRHAAGGFVLAFHSIPPDTFARLVESLEGFTIVPLAEMVARNKSGRSTAGLFAITVDDGVGENVVALSAVLLARRWPATFYLPTAYLDSKRGMAFQWWRAVMPLLSPPEKAHTLNGRLEHLWRTQQPATYLPLLEETIAAVERDLGISREVFQPPAPVSWEEVRRISRNDWISFESHGTAHVAVAAMTAAELAAEMRESNNRIEEHTGRPCRHFCYPFGSPESIGSTAPRVARQFYDSAVTMSLGGIDGADPWLLPRIPVYTENSSFFVQLKVGLSCSRIRSALHTKKGRECRVPADSPARTGV